MTKKDCLEEVEKAIKDNFGKMVKIYNGKLPFVLLGQTLTDEQGLSFYKQGVEDSIKVISKLKESSRVKQM